MSTRVIPLDFSQTPSTAAVDPGEYFAVIEKIEAKASPKSEYPYLNWVMRITEGPHAQRLVYMMTSCSPAALFRLRECFEALDVYEEGMELLVDQDTNLLMQPRLVGLACIAVVTNEDYQGQPRARVNRIKAAAEVTDLENMAAFT